MTKAKKKADIRRDDQALKINGTFSDVIKVSIGKNPDKSEKKKNEDLRKQAQTNRMGKEVLSNPKLKKMNERAKKTKTDDPSKN
ncbi:MAG: hypothetical protein NVS9B7_20870 [Flavisolibacter sp.]